ncbi:MAG: hypothetical protein AAGD38_00470 [Acidobacteriota bacterium]
MASCRPGVLGALMDEYERACHELTGMVDTLDDTRFLAVLNPVDDELRSIQAIVRHVVQAGYAHVNHIRIALAIEGSRVEVPSISRTELATHMRVMLRYTAETFDDRWSMTDDDLTTVEIDAMWGQRYDLEQMFEHMIVHVLRHRRQIERLLSR